MLPKSPSSRLSWYSAWSSRYWSRGLFPGRACRSGWSFACRRAHWKTSPRPSESLPSLASSRASRRHQALPRDSNLGWICRPSSLGLGAYHRAASCQAWRSSIAQDRPKSSRLGWRRPCRPSSLGLGAYHHRSASCQAWRSSIARDRRKPSGLGFPRPLRKTWRCPSILAPSLACRDGVDLAFSRHWRLDSSQTRPSAFRRYSGRLPRLASYRDRRCSIDPPWRDRWRWPRLTSGRSRSVGRFDPGSPCLPLMASILKIDRRNPWCLHETPSRRNSRLFLLDFARSLECPTSLDLRSSPSDLGYPSTAPGWHQRPCLDPWRRSCPSRNRRGDFLACWRRKPSCRRPWSLPRFWDRLRGRRDSACSRTSSGHFPWRLATRRSSRHRLVYPRLGRCQACLIPPHPSPADSPCRRSFDRAWLMSPCCSRRRIAAYRSSDSLGRFRRSSNPPRSSPRSRRWDRSTSSHAVDRSARNSWFASCRQASR